MSDWQIRLVPPPPPPREQERMIFTVGDDVGIQVVTVPGENSLSLTAHDDWCGDSISGFGATVSYELDADQVRTLHASLGAWLTHKGIA